MTPTPGSPTMSTTSSTQSWWEARDTGFPEPLCGERNTRRPHPEANLSPNASLSSEDIDPSRIYVRQQRRSFRATRNKNSKRTLSHGKIDDDALGDESPSGLQGLALAMATPPNGSLPQLQSEPPASRHGSEAAAAAGLRDGRPRSSKDSTDSMQSHEPLSPTSSRSPHKKRDAFRRLWNHGPR